MKRVTNTFLYMMIAFIICATMLAGCSNVVNPDQGHRPSVPVEGSDNDDPSNPNQDQAPDESEDENSQFIDGDDHLTIPF